MKMKQLTWLAMAVVMSCAACTAKDTESAKEAKQPEKTTQEEHKDKSVEENFRRLDANNDASISRDEAQQGGSTVLQGHFDSFDTDKNGGLSLQEVTAFVLAQREQVERQRSEAFSRLDANHDGGFSKEEAEKENDPFLIANFDAIDTSKDGKLSLQELNTFAAAPQPAQIPQAVQPGQSSVVFSSWDKDANGTISRDELKDHPELFQNFDKMDTDHDGKVTQQEIMAFAHFGGTQGPATANK